jgi:hypothetical protein
MSSLSWNQLTDSLNHQLSLPENVEKLTITDAALAYARCGWYVLPIAAGTKHPGSLLGTSWPEQSTRDPEQIKRLFKYPNTAIALHVGKSGAVVFDVDEPANLSLQLQLELLRANVPFQSTRLVGDERRGHYVFLVPNGCSYGNSLGGLGKGWGDVRGMNGIIVASPSPHQKEFGYYKWKRTGPVPLLPPTLAMLIPQRTGDSSGKLSFEEGRTFVSANNGNTYPALLQSRLAYLRENPPTINNRHTAIQRFLMSVLKDSTVGFYPASEALNQTQAFFYSIKSPDEQTPREFEGMALWAMAQVEAMTEDEKAFHALNTAPHLEVEIMKWWRSHGK